jgi:hypothetical protein
VFRALTFKITALNLRKLSDKGEALALRGRSGYSQKMFVVKHDDLKVDWKNIIKIDLNERVLVMWTGLTWFKICGLD